jgi:hypothetical protein
MSVPTPVAKQRPGPYRIYRLRMEPTPWRTGSSRTLSLGTRRRRPAAPERDRTALPDAVLPDNACRNFPAGRRWFSPWRGCHAERGMVPSFQVHSGHSRRCDRRRHGRSVCHRTTWPTPTRAYAGHTDSTGSQRGKSEDLRTEQLRAGTSRIRHGARSNPVTQHVHRRYT